MAANWNKAFWQETYRTKISSIIFKKENIAIPQNTINWDVQENNKCARIASYIQDDGNNGYVLTIVSPHTIYANARSFQYFKGFTNLKFINFDNFDTSKCRLMYYMFYNCNSLTNLNIENFNIDNVTEVNGMFYNCKKLETINLCDFHKNKVKNLSSLFYECQSLKNINLSKLNTTNVTEMYAMFYGCSSLNILDLSNFDTSKVTKMSYMFLNCENLTTIYVSEKWSTENVKNDVYMFKSNVKLVGENGTKFSSSHNNKEYARIDKGESEPGYFTLKK